MLQKVLVLDDCQSFAEELRKSLSIQNYQVLECSDSNIAIDLCLNQAPDIFVCDWQLDHGNNGLIVREILKSICPNLKVLFISAYNCHDLRENLKNQKNLYFLEKPFYKSRLLEAMTMIESRKYEEESNAIPVAIVELKENKKFIAYNKLAKTIPLEQVKLDIISSKKWIEITCDSQSFLTRVRIVPNSERVFVMMIDKKNEMLIRDPRYQYFLTGTVTNQTESNGRMLVIDQHQAIRTLASEIMYENMVFCHTAISIDEGLEILKKDRLISAVVVDSSFDQKVIKKLILSIREKRSDVKIIGTFASSIPNIAEYKFDDLLSKPFSAQNLVQSFFR